MTNLSAEKLGQMALNDTKPRTAIKVRCYVYLKGEQILGRTPTSLGEAIVAIIKHRQTGYIAK